MDSLDERLYVAHSLSTECLQSTAAWDAAIAEGPPHEPIRWHARYHRYMRSVVVSASTRIEGNPMSPPEVDALLSSDTVTQHERHIENLNYNRALDLVTSFAVHSTFEWQAAAFAAIKRTLLHRLPPDRP